MKFSENSLKPINLISLSNARWLGAVTKAAAKATRSANQKTFAKLVQSSNLGQHQQQQRDYTQKETNRNESIIKNNYFSQVASICIAV